VKAMKRARLAGAGWKTGTVKDFLGLDAEEAAFVELKVALGERLREWRMRRELTQEELARRLGSSQSRVAKMEAADASVSLDLLVRALFRLGVTRRELARVIA
jgi:predicted XRE-type DNA-binding protein